MKKLETKSTILLKHHLKALKLPTMTESARRWPPDAKENVDHLGFLLQLCELELLERERRAAARRLKSAKFPTVKGLDAFDFAAVPSVNKQMILELMRCEFVDRRENVLLIGGRGTEKTHLATVLGMEAWPRGKRVRFYRVTELATQLLEAREERQLARLKSAAGEAGSADPGRVGLRAGEQGGCGAAVGRDQHGVRAVERAGDDEPAVRGVDGGAGERAADRRDAGPPDASLHHGRDGEGELPAERCAAASPRRGGRPSTPGRPRSNLVSPGDPLFDRPALRFPTAVHIDYLENNRHNMKYDEYLAAGYPIGSGVAEGACRHLVKDRLKQTGMRWTVAGAQAMLHVRALYLNDQWEEFVEYRIGREQAGLYGRNAA